MFDGMQREEEVNQVRENERGFVGCNSEDGDHEVLTQPNSNKAKDSDTKSEAKGTPSNIYYLCPSLKNGTRSTSMLKWLLVLDSMALYPLWKCFK